MLFNSISYLIFFPLVLLCYWISPARFRRPILLAASYVFYMSWIPAYGLLIGELTAVNYLLALAIDRFGSQSRYWLLAGLVVNLGTLCYFKYTNFLLKSVLDGLTFILPFFHCPMPASESFGLNVILPLGISFFAFEFIHYLTDVYKGDKPIANALDFGLFAAFFPSQIAGPIKRYQDFMHQLAEVPVFDRDLFHRGFVLLLQGLFKKVALSDNLAPLSNAGFAATGQLGTSDCWIAVAAFTLQIYFDFSGYTDMGRGSAMMLGYTLPDNFNFPYLASSLSDFWKRWHISLSTWLRDYLYVPLGGGRCQKSRKYRNLLITMLLGGLWHGAAWHFVAWGGFHGLGLIANHQWDDFVGRTPFLQKFHATLPAKCLCMLATLFLVVIGWVLFRADTLSQALSLIAGLFCPAPSTVVAPLLASSPVLSALGVYCLYALLFSLRSWRTLPWLERIHSQPAFALTLPSRACLYAGVVLAVIGFAPPQPSPFIYFQF